MSLQPHQTAISEYKLTPRQRASILAVNAFYEEAMAASSTQEGRARKYKIFDVLRGHNIENILWDISDAHINQSYIIKILKGLDCLEYAWEELPKLVQENILNAIKARAQIFNSAEILDTLHVLVHLDLSTAAIKSIKADLWDAITHKSHEYASKNIADILFSLRKLNFQPKEIIDILHALNVTWADIASDTQNILIDAVERYTSESSPQEIGEVLKTLGNLGLSWKILPEKHRRLLGEAIERSAERFHLDGLIHTFEGLTDLGLSWREIPVDAKKMLINALEKNIRSLKKQNILPILTIWIQFKIPWRSLSDVTQQLFMENIEKNVHTFNIKIIIDLLMSLSKVGVSWENISAETQMQLLELIKHNFDNFSAFEAIDAMRVLAVLNCDSLVAKEMVENLWKKILSKINLFELNIYNLRILLQVQLFFGIPCTVAFKNKILTRFHQIKEKVNTSNIHLELSEALQEILPVGSKLANEEFIAGFINVDIGIIVPGRKPGKILIEVDSERFHIAYKDNFKDILLKKTQMSGKESDLFDLYRISVREITHIFEMRKKDRQEYLKKRFNFPPQKHLEFKQHPHDLKHKAFISHSAPMTTFFDSSQGIEELTPDWGNFFDEESQDTVYSFYQQAKKFKYKEPRYEDRYFIFNILKEPLQILTEISKPGIHQIYITHIVLGCAYLGFSWAEIDPLLQEKLLHAICAKVSMFDEKEIFTTLWALNKLGVSWEKDIATDLKKLIFAAIAQIDKFSPPHMPIMLRTLSDLGINWRDMSKSTQYRILSGIEHLTEECALTNPIYMLYAFFKIKLPWAAFSKKAKISILHSIERNLSIVSNNLDILWQLAKVGVTWQELADSSQNLFFSAIKKDSKSLNSRYTVNLIWALARLGMPCQKFEKFFFISFDRAINRNANQFHPEDTVDTLWALAKLGVSWQAISSETKTQLCKAIVRDFDKFNLREIITILWSLALVNSGIHTRVIIKNLWNRVRIELERDPICDLYESDLRRLLQAQQFFDPPVAPDLPESLQQELNELTAESESSKILSTLSGALAEILPKESKLVSTANIAGFQLGNININVPPGKAANRLVIEIDSEPRLTDAPHREYFKDALVQKAQSKDSAYVTRVCRLSMQEAIKIIEMDKESRTAYLRKQLDFSVTALECKAVARAKPDVKGLAAAGLFKPKESKPLLPFLIPQLVFNRAEPNPPIYYLDESFADLTFLSDKTPQTLSLMEKVVEFQINTLKTRYQYYSGMLMQSSISRGDKAQILLELGWYIEYAERNANFLTAPATLNVAKKYNYFSDFHLSSIAYAKEIKYFKELKYFVTLNTSKSIR